MCSSIAYRKFLKCAAGHRFRWPGDLKDSMDWIAIASGFGVGAIVGMTGVGGGSLVIAGLKVIH